MDLLLPALRERRSEIIPLIQQYQRNFNEKYQLEKSLHPEVIESLTQHDWPGNIRQLVNVIERLMVCTPHSEINSDDLPDYLRTESGEIKGVQNLKDRVLAFERNLILDALNIHGSARAAAEALGVEQSTLIKKIARFKQ